MRKNFPSWNLKPKHSLLWQLFTFQYSHLLPQDSVNFIKSSLRMYQTRPIFYLFSPRLVVTHKARPPQPSALCSCASCRVLLEEATWLLAWCQYRLYISWAPSTFLQPYCHGSLLGARSLLTSSLSKSPTSLPTLRVNPLIYSPEETGHQEGKFPNFLPPVPVICITAHHCLLHFTPVEDGSNPSTRDLESDYLLQAPEPSTLPLLLVDLSPSIHITPWLRI